MTSGSRQVGRFPSRHGSGVLWLTWLALSVIPVATALGAQLRLSATDDRRPRFLLDAGNARVPVDVTRSPSLERPVTLELNDARLTDALAEISRQSGLAIVYSDDAIPGDARVDVTARATSVIAVLSDVLLDTGLDVVMRPDGSAALVRRPRVKPAVEGTITGKVTEARGGVAIAAVTVFVEGTNLGTTTRDDGTYTIAAVPAGTRMIVARRVGYTPGRRSVTVVDGQQTTVDFPLEAVAASLDAVVTTATGQQRRVELGNTVATVDVAVRGETAPVKSIGDLLNAQATGVTVTPGTQTGAASRVRIRGQSSTTLSNDPIYIIDGIRMTAVTGGISAGCTGTCTTVSRVNDLNPAEIETMEIVKGPSAATLYGTDAANGVIVITTKRGRAGPPAWVFYGEGGRVDDRNPYPANYALRGHSPTTPNVRRDCRSYEIEAGGCMLDSAVSQNIWKDGNLTPLDPGLRTVFGGQLSGGTNELRYFVAGDRQEDDGSWGLPTFDRQRFDSMKVKIEDYYERPNYLKQYSARANLNAVVTPKLDLALSSGYTYNQVRLVRDNPSGNGVWQSTAVGPGYDAGTTNSRGWPLKGFLGETPGGLFQNLNQETVNRFIGSANANWRPLAWLRASGDIGIDLTDRRDLSRARAGETDPTPTAPYSQDGRTRLTSFSTNLRATGTWQAATSIDLRSTLGVQTVSTDNSGVTSRGSGLPPGADLPSQATTFTVTTSSIPSRTLGAYLEEQVAIRDRLFLTGAVRTDQNNAFGTNFQSVWYPKASISWVATEEGFFPSFDLLNQLRLRGSYGASGVQPGPTQAVKTYSTSSVFFQGTQAVGIQLANPGNQDLKPERSEEFEAGFDSRWWNDRVSLDFTYYRKQTTDALITQPVAGSAGISGYLANLGGMRNEGIEYRLFAQPIDAQDFGFDVTFSGSNNKNTVTSLGGFVSTIVPGGSAVVVGKPVNAVFVRAVNYTDPNNNGVLAVSDMTLGTDTTYRGPQLDPIQLSLAANVHLVGRRLRIYTLFDRKDGGYAVDGELQFNCFVQVQCKPVSRLDAPLNLQAAAIARLTRAANDGFVESTAFTKWRELSVTYDLGPQLAGRLLRAKGVQITAGMRNIKIWKDEWSGIDPEAVASTNTNTFQNGLTSGAPSYYMLRFNLSY